MHPFGDVSDNEYRSWLTRFDLEGVAGNFMPSTKFWKCEFSRLSRELFTIGLIIAGLFLWAGLFIPWQRVSVGESTGTLVRGWDLWSLIDEIQGGIRAGLISQGMLAHLELMALGLILAAAAVGAMVGALRILAAHPLLLRRLLLGFTAAACGLSVYLWMRVLNSVSAVGWFLMRGLLIENQYGIFILFQ